MESRLRELRAFPGERRLGHGWRLAKAGGRTLRDQRGVAALTLALAVVAAAQLILVEWVGALAPASGDGHDWLARLLVNSAVLALATFLLVAISIATDAAVDGFDIEAREALAEARECAGPILAWVAIWIAAALASWLLGRALGAPWVGAVVFALWLVATFFVVPMLAVERVGVGEAISESIVVLRERWRGALGGTILIGIFGGLAFAAAGLVARHADALEREGSGRQTALLVVTGILIAIVFAVTYAAREAFATLLLRDGLGELPGHPPPGRARSRGASLARGTAVAVLLFAAFAGLGAWTKHDGETIRASDAPGENYEVSVSDPAATEIDSGAPVLFDGREVGTVLGSELDEEELTVHFHVEPGVGAQAGYWRVGEGVISGPYLELTPAPEQPDSEAQSL